MPDLPPEKKARQQIDAMLVESGWVVQDYKAFNPAAARGIALREVPLTSGGYSIFIGPTLKVHAHGQPVRFSCLPRCHPGFFLSENPRPNATRNTSASRTSIALAIRATVRRLGFCLPLSSSAPETGLLAELLP
jgi:hypothetical protein